MTKQEYDALPVVNCARASNKSRGHIVFKHARSKDGEVMYLHTFTIKDKKLYEEKTKYVV